MNSTENNLLASSAALGVVKPGCIGKAVPGHEVAVIRADGSRKQITAETCVHFLHFARPDYATKGNLIKCNPAIKDVRDRDALRRAVAEAEFIARERHAFGKALQDMPLMQRQLDKLRVPAEQARTMVFQTAQTLMRSDAGEENAYALLRILTPLIKFLPCRDARKVTGDAMEVPPKLWYSFCGVVE